MKANFTPLEIEVKFTRIYPREIRYILQLFVQWVKVGVGEDGGHRHPLAVPCHQAVPAHLVNYDGIQHLI